MQDQGVSAAMPHAPKNEQGVFEIPVDIVGGNRYGRYPKINQSQTYNMMISDGWLVDYAGFQYIATISDNPVVNGRGIHTSTVFNRMYCIVGSLVVYFDHNLNLVPVGALQTSTGDVYIAENNTGIIELSDSVNLYSFNQHTSAFTTITQATLGFTPGFLSYQNTYFLCASTNNNQWRLSTDGITWPDTAQFVGQIQTKPDTTQAAVPMPGRGNMTFIFGNTIGEQWTFTGGALFPWSRNNSISLDYGCINAASIAFQGNYIVWVGISEEAGPVIMFTNGADIQEVSTDGIDYLLSTLTNPEDCSGFLVKIDGHLFYQVTFKTDNLTLALDLENKTFFTITDENMNYHPARKIVFFNNVYYFVSYNDGNLYAFGTNYTSYNYQNMMEEIPRIRITSPTRLPTQRPMIFKSLGFTIEQGQPNKITQGFTEFMITEGDGETFMLTEDGKDLMITEGSYSFLNPNVNMQVFLSVSRDGGESFGNAVPLAMNFEGKRKSRFIFQRLGRANDFTARLQFVGSSRYVVGPGVLECYL